jgi:surface antigen
MKKLPLIYGYAALLTSALLLGSCATSEQTGQLLGGVAGAAAGTQVGDGTGRTIATIGGAVIGAYIGGRVGSGMDNRDRQQSQNALENTETGQRTRWVNPDTGYSYDLVPTNTYQANQRPCRDYTMEAVIDGRNETINGTACRQADGSWQ